MKNLIILLTCIYIACPARAMQLSGAFNASPFRGDSLYVYCWEDVISGGRLFTEHKRYAAKIDRAGNFKLEVPMENDLAYISLARHFVQGQPLEMVGLFLAGRGDSIHVMISYPADEAKKKVRADNGDLVFYEDVNYSFSGRGYEKYECRFLMERAEKNALKQWQAAAAETAKGQTALMNGLFRHYIRSLRMADSKRAVLETYKGRIAAEAFAMMKTDVFSTQYELIYRILNINLPKIRALENNDKKEFDSFYTSFVAPGLSGVSDDVLERSAAYPAYAVARLKFENGYRGDPDRLERMRANPGNTLEEKIITAYMLDHVDRLPDGLGMLNALIPKVKKTEYRNELIKVRDRQNPGIDLSGFTLTGTAKEPVKLSDYKGKVLLLDFWFTGCGGCSVFYKTILSHVEERYAGNDQVVFVTVSIDTDHEKWLKSIRSGLYTSEKVLNLSTGGQGAGHPIIKQLSVSTFPRPVLIDRNGQIFSNDFDDLRTSVGKISEVIDKALAHR